MAAARDTIRFGAKQYRLWRGPGGAPSWSTTSEPSQRGDAGALDFAEWRVDGPDLYSEEQITQGGGTGYLGRAYGDGTDGRWLNQDMLGPLVSTITCSTYDRTHGGSIPGTVTAVPGTTLIPGYGAAGVGLTDVIDTFGRYAYVGRGTEIAKLNLGSMALVRSGLRPKEPVTSSILTRAQTGASPNELSLAFGDQAPYQVLTIAGDAPNSDTWQENASGQAIRIFGAAPDRVAGLTKDTVRGNILTGTVTMRTPNWQTVATITGEEIVFTGFGLDGNLWVIGTSNGPYMLDSDTALFFPLIPEIDSNIEQCRAMQSWFPIGLCIPLRDGIRFLRGGYGESFGLERFLGNQTPVQGYATAVAASTRWLYTVHRNEQTTNSWLVAWRPRMAGDQHDNPLSPYVLASFPALQSRALRYLGRLGGLRANDTLLGGYGSNVFWTTIGRTSREPDDDNYTTRPSGTTYLTTLRRMPETIKDLLRAEFETLDCAAGRSVTVTVNCDGTDVALPAITADGFQSQPFVTAAAPTVTATGRRLTPRIAYSSNVSTETPKVRGLLRLFFRTRPAMVNVRTAVLELGESAVSTGEAKEEAALAALAGTVVLVERDPDGDSWYGRVRSVRSEYVDDSGGGADRRPRGIRRRATITFVEWPVA